MDIFQYAWLVPITLLTIILIIWKKSPLGIGKHTHPNLPPGPSSLPIIGNLHQLSGKNLHEVLWKVSRKYGPIMFLRFGSQPYVVISSSELANQALKTYDDALCTRPYTKNWKTVSFGYNDVSFSPYGDHWKMMRNILSSDFLGGKRGKMFRKVLDTELRNMLGSLQSGSTINLEKKLMDIIMDVACKMAVSKSYRDVSYGGWTMREMLDEMLIMIGGSYSDIFPTYGWILEYLSGYSRRLDRHMKRFDGFLEMILDEHIDHTNEEDQDLLDVCRSRLNRLEQKTMLSTVFNGAIDTTSITTVWAMSEIVNDPRVMHKLQHEIRSCTGKKPQVEESDIAKMKYLKMVMKETLRLHASVPVLLTRESMRHVNIGGYDIPPGTNVLINSWGFARDPKVWTENATEFYPERFENIVVEQFEMAPFGGGRRICPGYNLANSVMEFMIANLLYSFDWKLPNGQTNVDMAPVDGKMLVGRKTPLYLVPVKVDTSNN